MAREMITAASRANLTFGELVVKSLQAFGVEHFVVSPGSRSTPLAMAVAGLGEAHGSVWLDERSASFYALGRVKASRRPVAFICTSGTAGAHAYPAVIEARESGLPFLVLTADRPPELRHGHAGQTIDQSKLYGTTALFQAELPLPEPDPFLGRQVREICRRAVEASLGLPHGPVHLNCPYREPFFPAAPHGAYVFEEDLLEGLRPIEAFGQGAGTSVDLPGRTLILAGPRPWRDPEADLEALASLARRGGWPILADGSNPFRYRQPTGVRVIRHADRLARDEAAWQDLQPEALVLWGEPPTSKVLRQQLSRLDLPGYLIGPGKPGINPVYSRITWAGPSVAGFAERVRAQGSDYAARWAQADALLEARLVEALQAPHALFEGDVHRLLGAILPAGAPVFFASSLAIRDADWFMPAGNALLDPYSQRGANGIDGTLSLVRGLAAASGRPAFLVSGDLAFLHDSNGLLGSAGDDPGTFVVLLNNEGGGIFQFLPVAEESAAFERWFATPQSVDFSRLIGAHGGGYGLVDSLGDLRRAVEEWDGRGLRVAEVRIDRAVSRDLHRRFLSL